MSHPSSVATTDALDPAQADYSCYGAEDAGPERGLRQCNHGLEASNQPHGHRFTVGEQSESRSKARDPHLAYGRGGRLINIRKPKRCRCDIPMYDPDTLCFSGW